IPKPNTQPPPPLSITSGTLDHSSRNRALAFHVVTDGLIGLRLGEDERGGACIEIAFREDMSAVHAFMPGHHWRKPWLVDWMFRTIGAKDRWNIAAFAERTGKVGYSLYRRRGEHRRAAGQRWGNSEARRVLAVRPGLPYPREGGFEVAGGAAGTQRGAGPPAAEKRAASLAKAPALAQAAGPWFRKRRVKR